MLLLLVSAVSSVELTVGDGALSFTGYAPSVTVGSSVAVGDGTILFDGNSLVMSLGRSISIGAGEMTLQGLTPTVVALALSVPDRRIIRVPSRSRSIRF